MSYSTRMRVMRTGQITDRGVVDGPVLAMATTIATARVRRMGRVVRMGPGKRRNQRMGRGKRRGKGRGRGKQWRNGRGRETEQGKVLLHKPQGEMISLVPLLCSCSRKFIRQTRTWRAN
jgi:hypothetical protein